MDFVGHSISISKSMDYGFPFQNPWIMEVFQGNVGHICDNFGPVNPKSTLGRVFG